MGASGQSIKVWIQACRVFSLTASVVPVLLGAGVVVYMGVPARWWLFFPILLASVTIHIGTNLVGEYFDFKKGVDRPDTCGGSRVLVENLLDPKHVFYTGMACFALSAAIGLVFIAIHGWPILLLGLVGIAGGFFYTATPVGYKYLGLGDLCVFILMGPLMVMGSFFVLTGTYHHSVLLISLPIGCLVAAILSANNLRDILHDTQAHISTTATLLGHRVARWEYSGLVTGAYVISIILVIIKVLPLWSLITMLTIPPAVKNIKTALKSDPESPDQIVGLDVETAKLHLPFGLLLIISLILGGVL